MHDMERAGIEIVNLLIDHRPAIGHHPFGAAGSGSASAQTQAIPFRKQGIDLLTWPLIRRAVKLVRTAPLAAGPLGLVALLNVVLLLLCFSCWDRPSSCNRGSRSRNCPRVVQPAAAGQRPVVTLQPGPPLRIFYRDQRVTLAELGRQLAAYHGSRARSSCAPMAARPTSPWSR